MADDKMKSEDMVPQADKQAHTDIAQREGKEGAQAKVINARSSTRNRRRRRNLEQQALGDRPIASCLGSSGQSG